MQHTSRDETVWTEEQVSQIMEGKNQIIKTHLSLFCKVPYLFLYLFKIFVDYPNHFFSGAQWS